MVHSVVTWSCSICMWWCQSSILLNH